ncbi:hypothetical protein ACFY71_04700 [Streptomyces cinerochromogenes]|uniref:hypothetical protein n=1 Tax=Streptomyces cinerochromogenes TaxID=66422 RepID=UPI0036B592F5
MELPLTLNSVSDTGVELDGKKPVFSGTDDDLRGDYSSSPGIFVMAGQAAEVPGDAADLKFQDCAQLLQGGVNNNPVVISVRRGTGLNGTYCFTTTKGRIAAFTIVSAGPDPVLPESVTVKVVLWE